MHLNVEAVPLQDQSSGIVARFEGRDDEHAFAFRGEAKRGQRGLTIARLEVAPDNEDVTGTALRSVSVGEVLLRLRAMVSAPVDPPPSEDSGAACTCGRQRGGRPEITDDLLRRVAVAYLEEMNTGAGVLHRVAARFGRPEGTVRGWITRARSEGFLGPGVQGRRGCEPGSRLTEITGGAA